MRWRLLRRRLSISAPRVAVRSHLPWPLRWALAAVMLGFSAALALWAFSVGRDFAGLGHALEPTREDLGSLQSQLQDARHERDQAMSIAHAADSLLKAEHVTQQRLADQVRELEGQNQQLRDDVGFFERMLPNAGAAGMAIRGLQLEMQSGRRLHYQFLVLQAKNDASHGDFEGRVELSLSGTLAGKAWAAPPPQAAQALRVHGYLRVDGSVNLPAGVEDAQLQVRILDQAGAVRATEVAHPGLG